VAADRVAVMGYSMGGAAALIAVEKSALQAFAREGSERAEPAGLRAMIAYCPPCAFSSGVLTAPALILVGERDDWIPAAACRKLAAAGLAREYAPELGIKGAVAIGVSYFTAATFFVPRPPGGPDPTLAYTLYLALFATRVDPALKPEGMLSARALPLLAEARTTCVPPLFSDVLAAGLSRALPTPAPRKEPLAFPTRAPKLPACSSSTRRPPPRSAAPGKRAASRPAWPSCVGASRSSPTTSRRGGACGPSWGGGSRGPCLIRKRGEAQNRAL
jgi:hypothetical protein